MAKAHHKAKFCYNDGICEEHDIVLPEDPKVVKVMGLLGELGWLSDTGFGNTTIYYEEGSFTHVSFKNNPEGTKGYRINVLQGIGTTGPREIWLMIFSCRLTVFWQEIVWGAKSRGAFIMKSVELRW